MGNKSENKAILTAVNVGTKKSEVFKGLNTEYTGSKLTFTGSDGGILNEIRTDYYARCTYEFTFQYVKEEVIPKEYKFTEGANQTYTIDDNPFLSTSFVENLKKEYAGTVFYADCSLFTNKVYVDNKLVDSTNYNSKSGSTVITLKDEYLKTLSVGEHTLKVAFSDNGEAITKFIIKEKQQNTNIEDKKKHLNDTDINIKDIVINVKSENENLFSDNLNKEFNQDRRFNQNNSNKNKKNNNQIIEELHNSEHNKDDDNLNILI